MKELLFSITKKDFEVTWFSGTGAGGQYRNKHQNCCRIKHIETGIIGTGQSNRDRVSNQKEAFNSLYNNPQFQVWLNKKISECFINKEEIERKVDEAMKDIKVEVYENGEWVEKSIE